MAAEDKGVPIRVGINAGSLEKELQTNYGEPNADALVESAMRHVEILNKNSFDNLLSKKIIRYLHGYKKVMKKYLN